MAVNPDPRPGRWILPLVVLGMIAFTYFFVRELPEASTETTLVTGAPTSSTAPESSTTTTAPESSLDPETQAYLDEIDRINSDLQLQRTEMVTVNDAFNQDPRGIEFSEAESRFETVLGATQDLADALRALTPPVGLESNHQLLQDSLDLAATSVQEALDGLRSTDTGQLRNAAVASMVTASDDFATEVTNTHNAAGG